MKCNHKCLCKECEMLIDDWDICYIEQKFLDEKRTIVPAYKCRKYGFIIEKFKNPEKLKQSRLLDDFIYL